MASYSPLDSRKWYGLGYSIHIRQIEDQGQRGEHELAPDVGAGYNLRLYNISRLEEPDGGLYVEVEAIAMSRGIPVVALRSFAIPIVRACGGGRC